MTPKAVFKVLSGAAMLVIAGTASAGGDAVAGQQKATAKACVTCHGEDGNGIDKTYPRLAGQYADYMVQALKDYKAGKRRNAIMAGLVTTLSEQDMEDISAFYASQSGLKDLSID